MRSVYILSLFVVSALASDSKYGQPMDYFDDDFQSNLKVGPDSTFSFNFEQIRRDQPPQVEIREENVGRYINNRPRSTTPASIFSMKEDRNTQHVFPTMAAVDYHHQQHHQTGPLMSSVPPPPKFSFSRQNNEPINKHSAPVWNTHTVHHNAFPSNSYNNFPHQAPTLPTAAPQPVQWTAPPKPQPAPSHYFPSNQPLRVPTPEGIHFSPSASYVSDSITNNNVPRAPPSLPSRGNHKFSWDDLKKPQEMKPVVPLHQPQHASSTPHSVHKKPPPPVPTLSPWYDGFGK